jgi:hypothetical protein
LTEARSIDARSGDARSRDPALDALALAFERGDYGRVRRDGLALMGSSASPEVRAAALALVSRTRPDPRIAVLFGLTAALLAFLSTYWWWKAGGVQH